MDLGAEKSICRSKPRHFSLITAKFCFYGHLSGEKHSYLQILNKAHNLQNVFKNSALKEINHGQWLVNKWEEGKIGRSGKSDAKISKSYGKG